MKKILFAILCAGAVISCAKEEVITAEKEAITFENAFVDNATKALDSYTVTTGNLTTFNVWGTTQMPSEVGEPAKPIVPIFDEVAVSLDGTVWTYGAAYTQYWIPGNAYVFAAAKNYKADSEVVVKGLPSTFDYEAASQADFIYASAQAQGKESGSNNKVAFTFDHLLSKAYFTVKNEMSGDNTNYSYRVSNIAINNVVEEGTYTVSSETWETDGEYSLSFGNVNGIATATDAAAVKIYSGTTNYTSHYSRLLIPATYAALNITCTIETLYGDAVIDVENYSKNIAYTFAKGKAYNFVLTLQNPGDEIEFTVTKVNDWVPADGSIPTPDNHQANN